MHSPLGELLLCAIHGCLMVPPAILFMHSAELTLLVCKTNSLCKALRSKGFLQSGQKNSCGPAGEWEMKISFMVYFYSLSLMS